MIGFELDDEQKALRRTAREFAEKEIRPVAVEIDHEMSHDFPVEVVRKAARTGFTTIRIPEEYGGGGGGDFELALMTEELAWGDAGLASTIGGTNALAVKPILYAGTEAQKKKWLQMICDRAEEPFLTGFCCTEPSSGSDVFSDDPDAGIRTTAKRDGSDYILNGTKIFITNGGVAGVYAIWARTDITKGASWGLSCFIVPADAPGFSIGQSFDKMGQRLNPTAEIILDDVRLPEENLLGEEGDGVPIIMDFLTGGGSVVGAVSVGVAQAAYEAAREYAMERIQGGHSIIYHQAIAFKLADMVMNIEAARLLVWETTWVNDNIEPNNRLASMAKVFCSDMAQKVTYEAVQIFGGYGYMRDYPVEKYMRDARVCPIYDGTNEMLKDSVIAPSIAVSP